MFYIFSGLNLVEIYIFSGLNLVETYIFSGLTVLIYWNFNGKGSALANLAVNANFPVMVHYSVFDN